MIDVLLLRGRGTRLAVPVGLLGAGGCWWVTARLWQPGQSAVDRANVLSLTVGLVGLVVAVASLWVSVLGRLPGVDTDAELDRLGMAVAAERGRFLDQALGVAWREEPAEVRFADPEVGQVPAPVADMLLHWQDLAGLDAGSITEVAGFYRGQQSGRLVVLGAPGAGKTVLLSRLVVDLIQDRRRARADGMTAGTAPSVPVMLSLPSWAPTDLGDAAPAQAAVSLSVWVAERLIQDYGLRPHVAADLVAAGRVLPVLDGLDEMDPATVPAGPGDQQAPPRRGRGRAQAVLQALNHHSATAGPDRR